MDILTTLGGSLILDRVRKIAGIGEREGCGRQTPIVGFVNLVDGSLGGHGDHDARSLAAAPSNR